MRSIPVFLAIVLLLAPFHGFAASPAVTSFVTFRTRDTQFVQLQWNIIGDAPSSYVVYRSTDPSKRGNALARISNDNPYFEGNYYNDLLPDDAPSQFCYTLIPVDRAGRERAEGAKTACWERPRSAEEREDAIAPEIKTLDVNRIENNLHVKLATDEPAEYSYTCSPWMPLEPLREEVPFYTTERTFVIPALYGYVPTCAITVFDRARNERSVKTGPHPIGSLTARVADTSPEAAHPGAAAILLRLVFEGPETFMPSGLRVSVDEALLHYASNWQLREERQDFTVSKGIVDGTTIRFDDFESPPAFSIVGTQVTNVYTLVVADLKAPPAELLARIALGDTTMVITPEGVRAEGQFPFLQTITIIGGARTSESPLAIIPEAVTPLAEPIMQIPRRAVSPAPPSTVAAPATSPEVIKTYSNCEGTNSCSKKLTQQLSGRIILKAEGKGESFYMHPQKEQAIYLGRPADAFAVMRFHSLGISDSDLQRIPVAGSKRPGDVKLVARLKGLILLQVESHGEAWYVHPETGKRHFLNRPDDAFRIMRELALGVSDAHIAQLPLVPLQTP